MHRAGDASTSDCTSGRERHVITHYDDAYMRSGVRNGGGGGGGGGNGDAIAIITHNKKKANQE